MPIVYLVILVPNLSPVFINLVSFWYLFEVIYVG